MGALPESNYISPEDYLLWENDQPEGIKHEYVDGRIYAMTGASRAHNRAAGVLFARLFNHLEGSKCQVFQSDMKVGIQTLGSGRYYYPDVQVTCEEETASHVNTAPCLIIEVLSDSTSKRDRTEKLTGYRLIPELQEYLLCSQDSPHMEIYRKRADWAPEVFSAGQTLRLESVGLDISVDDIYGFLA
ncbi:MAG: Uma2 family endonuclease [Gammaproteobacteria bacterium]|nr:Uma2 family endonuclease [Gammaproteobacteria bacterium]MBU1653973.1 Uma2 family endonuclease [Gammaproteobacteria bacterium]MBU1960475.1 Uma2 family endonuclease [Gammaproteobacteria bacterium]